MGPVILTCITGLRSSSEKNVFESEVLHQWFSNISVYQNHQEDLKKQMSLFMIQL